MTNGADDLSPSERVRRAFARIDTVERPEVWISLRRPADVIADATTVERQLAAGAPLPLAGRVVAVKDNIDVGGMPTTAGCPEFTYQPEATAPAVARLEAAGAIVIGKTNLDQFATGLVGTRSPYGAVRNALDPRRIAGGSSAGSAVAVALGIADIGVGTDTAGSGRVPAAFNGLVGLKPTPGLVPTVGVVPACIDYDCVSILTRDVLAGADAFRAMAGPHPGDPRSRRWPADVPLAAPPRPRVAIPRPSDLAPLSTPYRRAFNRALSQASEAGFELQEVDLSELLQIARLLYDGAIVAQRYAAVGTFLAGKPRGADPTVASIIMGARDISAVDYIADAGAILDVRSRLPALLGGASALLVPTTTEHPTIAEVAADPVGLNRRLGTYTNFCNLLELAAVAVPAGRSDDLPFGITFLALPFADQVAVDLAVRFSAADPSGDVPISHAGPAPCVSGNGIELAVFGAHLRGQQLNHELVALAARFIEEISTADDYRLVALPTSPPKPSLVPVGAGNGSRLPGELWRLSAAALGTLLAELPAPMALTQVALDDGRHVVGFGCTPDAASAATDITAYGGWVNYQLSVRT